MRPIWSLAIQAQRGLAPELDALADVEAVAAGSLRAALAAATEEGLDASSVLSLADAAETDLRAGCDLARHGYFKQAYTLWRSWYEESFFALYFLESPLHRTAWRVVDEIKEPGDRPAIELMLHQLLDVQRRHPFLVVYNERFEALYAGLKRQQPGKNDHPVKGAERCLTDLSQGVHGTYSPIPVRSEADLPRALGTHALPVLRRADAIVAAFCAAFLHDLLSPSEQELLEARSPASAPLEDRARALRELIRGIDRWLEAVADKGKKERDRRG